MFLADPSLGGGGGRPAALTDALLHMPMFPLPNLVLLPNTFLPLHIFEPRYRQLTRDALEGARLMLVAFQLAADDDPERDDDGKPPAVAPIAGVGEIVMAQSLPDGRFHIILRGCARVRIQRELPSALPYRICEATEIPDRFPAPGELSEAEATLRAQTVGLAGALPEKGDLLKQVVAAQASAAELVDVVASTLIADPHVRQKLLEMPDVGRRIQRVSAEVAALSARLVAPASLN